MTVTLASGDPGYPARLRERLGSAAPGSFHARGAIGLLRRPALAIFCSRTPAPELVLPALDAAGALSDGGVPTIGGFQSPVERMMLEVLLGGAAPVTVLLARAPREGRLPAAWQRAMDEERLLILSTTPSRRRVDASLAQRRNRIVAALAGELLVVHAAPGGGVHRLAEEALGWGTPVRVLQHPANEPLVLLGGAAWRAPPSGPQRAHSVEGDQQAGTHVRRYRHPEGGMA